MSRRKRHRFRWASLGAVAAVAVMAMGTALYEHSAKDTQPLDDYGTVHAVDPATETATVTPVDVRMGCRIGAFGVAPWLKPGKPKNAAWEQRTRKALAAMGVPDEAAEMALTRMRSGRADDALGMGNMDGTATASGTTYLPSFSTTYMQGGRGVVCHDSQTRFVSDHRQEFAVVYRVAHEDKVYHLGEFLACGNVSRFFPAPPGWTARYPHGEGAPAVSGRMAQRSDPATGGIIRADNAVPEPGTLALMCIAALAWKRKTKEQK